MEIAEGFKAPIVVQLKVPRLNFRSREVHARHIDRRNRTHTKRAEGCRIRSALNTTRKHILKIDSVLKTDDANLIALFDTGVVEREAQFGQRFESKDEPGRPAPRIFGTQVGIAARDTGN